jgi:adenine-specific DNA-methyltransferase
MSLWLREEVGDNQEAARELKDNNFEFDTPKPTRLISRVLSLSTLKTTSSIVVDFFAGSGTTLHAVMQLNAEDSGKRQCILVTNNENGIAEEVCYERNKRVINGYTKPNGTAVSGLTNNHLHYYQLDWFDELAAPLSQDKPNEHSSIRLARLMREMLMIKENCFEDIEAKILRGYHPELKFKDDNHPDLDVLESADKYVVIVYTDDAIADGVRIIEQLPDAAKPVVVYPFEYQGEPDPTPFETVKERVTLKALPSSYKETYDHILQDLRKRRRRFVISDEDTVAADLSAEHVEYQ